MKLAVWFAAVALTGLAPCRLYGQQAMGDGRALDNNLRVGSGGKNVAQPGIDYRARNDLVTGNVSGLGYFRGNIPYRAPGEFHGDLGSNRLFRFHARSLAAPAGSGYGLAAPARVYRSMDAVSVTDVQQVAQGVNLLRPRDAASVGGRLPSRVDTRWPDVSGRPGVSVGFIQKSDGRLLELSASPLLGVRVADLTPRVVGRPLLRDDVGPRPVVTPAQNVPGETADGLVGGPDQPALVGTDQILPWSVEPRRLDSSVRTMAQQIEDMQSRLPIPHVVIHGEPGQDVYRDFLFKVQENRQGRDVGESSNRIGPDDSLGGEPSESSEQDDALAPDQQPAVAESDLRSRRAARGVETAESAAEKLDRLAKAVDYDLAPVKSLTASTDEQTRQMLTRAEMHMAAEDYLLAETTYRALLELKPGNPITRVGLVHAQLGAGMMRSAGRSLYELLTRHPELIAARYNVKLLSAPARLEQAQDELKAMLPQDKTGQSALLLAYIGYQLSDEVLLRRGLDEAAERLPEDVLPQLLRRVWLERSKPAESDQADAESTTDHEPVK